MNGEMKELVLLRNSEAKLYKNCRLAWKWAYVDRIRSRNTKPPLVFGTWVHAALEGWYIPGTKRGVLPDVTFERIYKEYLRSGADEVMVKVGRDIDGVEGTRLSALDLGMDMLRGYVSLYGKDDRFEVLAPELSFQVDVHHPKTEKYLFTAVGQIDATVKDRKTNRIGFLEHKTGATLAPFGAPESLDEQSGMYWTFGPDFLRGMGVLGPKEEPDFLIFNRLKKTMADERPTDKAGYSLNKDGSISKKQPAPRFKRTTVYRSAADRQSIMSRSRAVVREMNLVRAGKLSAYKNPDRHCGYCEFYDMCEAHETGGDWRSIRDTMMTTWDPYEDHAEMELGDSE